jgi:hypothetical protein
MGLFPLSPPVHSGVYQMNEKRLYPRYSCSEKVRFRCFTGDPDVINITVAPSFKGKGKVLDVSKGGMCIATNSRVSVNLPVKLDFKIRNKKYSLDATVVRTGKIENNPSILTRTFRLLKPGRKYFIAFQFEYLVEDIDSADLRQI